jgi:hypothetical protein
MEHSKWGKYESDDHLLHPFRVYFYIFSTRFECTFTSSPLVSSVLIHLLHSFRVYLYIFHTLFECTFTSSPLVSSVFLQIIEYFTLLNVYSDISSSLVLSGVLSTVNLDYDRVIIAYQKHTRNECKRSVEAVRWFEKNKKQ